MTCDEAAEDRVNLGANRSTSLRCVRYSCGWPSCPLACGGTRGAHQRERPEGARRGGWARKSGVGAAAGAQSPPPGDYTGHYSTWSGATHGATVQDQDKSHLVQKRFGPQDEQPSWLAKGEGFRYCCRLTGTFSPQANIHELNWLNAKIIIIHIIKKVVGKRNNLAF